MAMADSEPSGGPIVRTDPDQPGERTSYEPGDDYFSSGSFSPVTVQLGDDADSESEGPEERRACAPEPGRDDSPQVVVQFGEDPGSVPSDAPE
jgi:hypothetical protein